MVGEVKQILSALQRLKDVAHDPERLAEEVRSMDLPSDVSEEQAQETKSSEVDLTALYTRIAMLESQKYRPALLGGEDGYFPVLVWQDGGSTDGDKTHACDRTYQARTMDATSETTGTQLGTGKTPTKGRWAGNYGKMDCPASTGAGRVGIGYYDAAGTFQIFDANETPDTGACS